MNSQARMIIVAALLFANRTNNSSIALVAEHGGVKQTAPPGAKWLLCICPTIMLSSTSRTTKLVAETIKKNERRSIVVSRMTMQRNGAATTAA